MRISELKVERFMVGSKSESLDHLEEKIDIDYIIDREKQLQSLRGEKNKSNVMKILCTIWATFLKI